MSAGRSCVHCMPQGAIGGGHSLCRFRQDFRPRSLTKIRCRAVVQPPSSYSSLVLSQNLSERHRLHPCAVFALPYCDIELTSSPWFTFSLWLHLCFQIIYVQTENAWHCRRRMWHFSWENRSGQTFPVT